MIRLVRESSPWIIKGLICAIAIAFIGSMGWAGFQASQPNTVARIGNYEVTKEEYLLTKQRYYRFYRDQLKQEDIKDETLSQLALNGLVTTKSWQALADEFNLVVSAQELHDSIVNQKANNISVAPESADETISATLGGGLWINGQLLAIYLNLTNFIGLGHGDDRGQRDNFL